MSDFSFFILANALAGAILIILLRRSPAQKAAARRLDTAKQRHTPNMSLEREFRRLIASRSAQSHSALARLIPKPALIDQRLSRSGLSIGLNQYVGINIALILLLASALLLSGAPLHIALLGSVPDGLLLPHLVVSFLIKRRAKLFITRFPDAIELMVRGLRSSLPIAQSIDVVAQDFSGPVGEEFQIISDRMKIGQTMDSALMSASDRLDLPEFKFFCISISVQRETGGNLSETLANLADVLRKRSQMKLKIKALSSEAKASAIIIGALPFLVFGAIYMTNPHYIGAFFTDIRLTILGIGSVVWIGIGAYIMAKMADFEI